MAMTATRLRILESQQTGIAKKVYAAVPINEPWSSTAIVNELHRTGGPRDLRIVEGCLNTLKEVGIVKEPSPGSFQRVKPKLKAEKEPVTMATPPLNPVLSAPIPKAAVPAPKGKSPEDKLGDLAASLRSLGGQLIATADLLDDITLEIEDESGAISEELVNLRHLKEALQKVM